DLAELLRRGFQVLHRVAEAGRAGRARGAAGVDSRRNALEAQSIRTDQADLVAGAVELGDPHRVVVAGGACRAGPAGLVLAELEPRVARLARLEHHARVRA